MFQWAISGMLQRGFRRASMHFKSFQGVCGSLRAFQVISRSFRGVAKEFQDVLVGFKRTLKELKRGPDLKGFSDWFQCVLRRFERVQGYLGVQ